METLTKTQEVRNAVNRATDTLLMDLPYDSHAAEALSKLGFTNSENVRDWRDHRENHDFAVYYRHRYPRYKFITEHQLAKIREKYGLSSRALQQFKGAVPEKNLYEMMQFTADADDLASEIGESDFRINIDRMTAEMISRAFGITADLMGTGQIVSRGTGKSASSDIQRVRLSKDMVGNPFRFYPEYMAEPAAKKPLSGRVSFQDVVNDSIGRVMITAPPELFVAPDPQLDPIVTVAVRGGYLIVTAWGPEASDPDVVNAQMN